MSGEPTYLLARSLAAGLLLRMLLSVFAPWAILASGWTGPDEQPQASGDPAVEDSSDVYLHTVQWPQESLSVIAAWYTGDGENWPTLAAWNGGDGSDAVRVNEVILIPKHLMITTVPMPASFVGLRVPEENRRPSPRKTAQRQPRRVRKLPVRKKARPAAQTSESAPKTPPVAEPLELFGPKE
ncbi:MAG: hypothetical protein MUF52_14840 [Syntrophobacteraceae bacterium]|jgi:hypothetical protein|nr:hypothetical protein [Syntrophobacteraceae bacterium]